MGKAPGHDVNEEMRSVEKEVDLLRERTQSLVSELERRIQERVSHARATVDRVKHAVDIKAQLREHPRAAAGIGAGAVVAVGLGIWLGVSRARRRNRFVPRMQRKASALRQILADPERYLQKKEPIGRRIVAAILATAATVLVRALTQRLVDQVRQPKRLAAPPAELPPMSTIPIT